MDWIIRRNERRRVTCAGVVHIFLSTTTSNLLGGWEREKMTKEEDINIQQQQQELQTDPSAMTYCDSKQQQDASSLMTSQRSYIRFNFSRLCRFTVSLPLLGLVICFVSANIYQQNDIHETHCRVWISNILVLQIYSHFINHFIYCRSTILFLPSPPSLEYLHNATSGG